ncbi:MAG: hypothetical protein AAFR61_17625 [Bacteroidota bacterium]
MSNIESKAWALIEQLTPAQQFYFALKILQRVQPQDKHSASSAPSEAQIGFDEEAMVNLILERKKSLESGEAKPQNLQQFKEDLYRKIEDHRS